MKLKLIASLIVATTVSSTAHAEGWTGQGEAGFVSSSGNTDSDSLNLGLKLAKEGKIWNHEIALAAYQSSTEGTDTADNVNASYTLKRNLTERSNIFFNFGYLDDDFDGFTEQLSASVGYGYKFINNEKTKWEGGAGIGYRDTSLFDIVTDTEGEDVSNVTFVLRSDFETQLTETTRFVNNTKAEIGSDNTYIENDAALYITISDKFSLKTGYLIRHNTDPAPSADETDTITSLSLVYGF